MESFTDFLCFRLGALSRKFLRYYNNRLSGYGVTLGQSFVLFHLMENDGSSVKDIAAGVQLDSPAVTGLVDRLVKEGLVVRKEDQNDRRSIQIFLTPKGRDIASQVGAIAMEYNQLIQDNILPEDMDAFDRSLTRLENNL